MIWVHSWGGKQDSSPAPSCRNPMPAPLRLLQDRLACRRHGSCGERRAWRTWSPAGEARRHAQRQAWSRERRPHVDGDILLFQSKLAECMPREKKCLLEWRGPPQQGRVRRCRFSCPTTWSTAARSHGRMRQSVAPSGSDEPVVRARAYRVAGPAAPLPLRVGETRSARACMHLQLASLRVTTVGMYYVDAGRCVAVAHADLHARLAASQPAIRHPPTCTRRRRCRGARGSDGAEEHRVARGRPRSKPTQRRSQHSSLGLATECRPCRLQPAPWGPGEFILRAAKN